MKRILIAIQILFLASPLFAAEPIRIAMSPAFSTFAGAGVAAADPCGCATTTYMFCYTGDYSGDADKACFTNGTASKDGTEVDTGTYVAISSDYISIDAQLDNHVYWEISSGDGFTSTKGTIFFSIYVTDGNANSDWDLFQLFEARYDANNYLYIAGTDGTSSKGNLYAVWRSLGGTTQTLTATIATDLGAWYRVGYTWDTTNGDGVHSISAVAITSATSWEDGTGTTLDAWTGEPSNIYVGERSYNQAVDARLIKDVYIFSTYKATDPLSP